MPRTGSARASVDGPWWRRAPSRRLQRGFAWAAVIANGGIAVTGATVRVTGSGLGCPTLAGVPAGFAGAGRARGPVRHPPGDRVRQPHADRRGADRVPRHLPGHLARPPGAAAAHAAGRGAAPGRALPGGARRNHRADGAGVVDGRAAHAGLARPAVRRDRGARADQRDRRETEVGRSRAAGRAHVGDRGRARRAVRRGHAGHCRGPARRGRRDAAPRVFRPHARAGSRRPDVPVLRAARRDDGRLSSPYVRRGR